MNTTTWKSGQYVTRTVHGTGDGRSFGGATLRYAPATEDGWARNDQTTEWHVFHSVTEAEAFVEKQNEYYDGSDYK